MDRIFKKGAKVLSAVFTGTAYVNMLVTDGKGCYQERGQVARFLQKGDVEYKEAPQ